MLQPNEALDIDKNLEFPLSRFVFNSVQEVFASAVMHETRKSFVNEVTKTVILSIYYIFYTHTHTHTHTMCKHTYPPGERTNKWRYLTFA